MTDTPTLTVRDHSEPCEHPLDPEAMYDGAYFDNEGGFWRCGNIGCPGGRERTFIGPFNEVTPGDESKPLLWVEVTE